MRVLLVGRSLLLRERVRNVLHGAGHELWTAEDTLAAVQAQAQHPDVILIAQERPAEACAALSSSTRPGGSRLVVLSPIEEDAEVARDAGAVFLGLPFDDAELLVTLALATRIRKRILLCDDSTLIHRHTVPILSEAGYEVCSALDGAEGLERCLELRPDLVITDIDMPRLDGYALCQALKARFPHLPVVICSALGEPQDMERGFDAGADDYLIKPAHPEELLYRVQLLLGAGRELPTRERLLVVDDSPAVRHLVAESMRRQGFSVLTAADGEAGLLAARTERPDLIITDYDMPRMTGFEMVHALRQDPRTRDIPVLMLTARSSRRDQAQMRAVGLTAFLVKPFSVDRCVATVERILAECRLRAYKAASRLYISDATVRAAEEAARSEDPFAVRASEQHVAVLFSDISGFTGLAARHSPREVVELLNAYFDVMCPVIRQERGDIDKFIGDAIMAVFDDLPDDPAALRAVRAGLRMQQALARWNSEHGTELGMRVGINTGTVVRGDIGSRYVRREYTVIGDVVNRAQRYESSAPVGGVLISESTYQVVRDQVRCEPRAGVRLKGVPEPVTAYLALELPPGGSP
ncbi:MAG: response regulator [Myxococcales bacterium]|nr:response regulator [Myxococcales bacterium]